jgi:signal transduction histidine kinase
VSTEAVESMTERLRNTAWIAAAVVLVSTVFSGLPSGTAEATAVIAVTALSVVLFLVGAKRRGHELTCAVLFTGTGICGAVVIGLEPDGPGFVIAFMAMAGLGLQLRRRLAVLFGAVVVVAASIAEAIASSHPVSGVLDIVLGAGFLLLASAYAAASNESHTRSLELLQQEEATRAAREEAAALAERGRLARELHDVLAHTLSGLSLQLEGARLLAERTHADPLLVEQISHAGRLAREGLNSAKSAVSTLRGDTLPGTADLPALVDNACKNGLSASYEVKGEPVHVAGDTGLAIYRTVQEALTNSIKYAGTGAAVSVVLAWSNDAVRVEIADSGGVSASVGLSSGGFGLAGLGERAALAGGRFAAGPSADGWVVQLTMPLATR